MVNTEEDMEIKKPEIHSWSTFDDISEGCMIIDTEWRYLYVNNTVAKRSGVQAREFIGKKPGAFFPNFKNTQLQIAIGKCLKERKSALLEEEVPRKGHDNVFIEFSIQPVPEGVFILSIDRTVRRKAEQEVRDSEAKYRSLMDSSPNFILVSQGGVFKYVNKTVLERLGWSLEEIQNPSFKPIDTWVAPRYRDKARRLAAKRLEGELNVKNESALLTRKGEEIDVIASSRIASFQGKPAIEVMMEDVTAQKRMATDLAQSEQRFRSSLDNIPMGCQIIGFDSRWIYVNEAHAKQRRTTKESLIGKKLTDVNIGTPRLKIRTAIEKCLQERVAVSMEDGMLLPSGEKIYLEWSIQPIPEGAFILSFDKTLEKSAEERAQLQSAALNYAANGIVITNPDGKIEWVNQAFSKLTGYTSEEAIGSNPRIQKSGKQDLAFYERLWGTIKSGKPWRSEIINRRKDGSLYDEEAMISSVLDKDGTITHFVAIKQDISERKRHEADKMDAMGLAAKSIAHDIRNPLSSIRTGASILKGASADESEQIIELIDRNVVRANDIVQSLMDFAHTQPLNLRVTDFNSFLKDSLSGIVLPKNVTLTTNYEALPESKLDQPMMGRVIMNLITNALHAMAEGGKLSITTRQTGGFIELTIKDSGAGISEENLKKIFSPFFTTKTQGTGLGLVNVKNTIEAHKGTIRIDSKVGVGTTIYITLPPAPKSSISTILPNA